MAIEPYICPLDPETGSHLKLYLFKDVENVEEIRSNIVSGAWDCAAINPRLVLAPLQVATAAGRAALAARRGALVTRSPAAELLFNLSLSKNISQSLSKFGLGTSGELLVGFIVHSEDRSEAILPQIKGEMVPIEQLRTFTDMKELKTVYKLKSLGEKSDEDLLDVIISRMVTKNFISH
ncbi:hypothetical protein JYU34_013178 [Plutella xylostella]|uniref:Uncharacterized protein n=1 Tax=Plutella xylostella TaxID=51655 RepID=A0ABQ7QD40_PLUXY|nr:EKC/KEOPS complex subunit Tprkb [Plutella xylostella]KAG7303146.1 hypothetical protein JYU34_013178 [Plutella xylostella]